MTSTAKPSSKLSLDTLDREVVEPGYQREPFVIEIGQQDITFTDPQELPWDVVVTMDSSPRRFFRAAIADLDQQRHVLKTELKLWQMKFLMEQFRDHYGIDAEGNDVASRR